MFWNLGMSIHRWDDVFDDATSEANRELIAGSKWRKTTRKPKNFVDRRLGGYRGPGG